MGLRVQGLGHLGPRIPSFRCFSVLCSKCSALLGLVFEVFGPLGFMVRGFCPFCSEFEVFSFSGLRIRGFNAFLLRVQGFRPWLAWGSRFSGLRIEGFFALFGSGLRVQGLLLNDDLLGWMRAPPRHQSQKTMKVGGMPRRVLSNVPSPGGARNICIKLALKRSPHERTKLLGVP